MKLLRFRKTDEVGIGLVDPDGYVRDVSMDVEGAGRVGDAAFWKVGIDALKQVKLEERPVVEEPFDILPCVDGIGKIICVGLNYREHAAESNMEVREEPIIFGKAISAVTGANGPIILPASSSKLDWEVELGVVIGEVTSHVGVEDASRKIGGFCIVNDVSERSWQLEGTGQWIKGKSYDSFAPVGPWLVTPDEIQNVQDLKIWLAVNDKIKQMASTADMIFKVNELVSYISQFMSLQPGDIIATGTPAGVGLGENPPTYLSEGDVVRAGITGLGVQRCPVVRRAE